MRVGNTIREIRERERNFKRSYVASKLHITTRAYSNIENDIADITISRLEELANILECTTDYILNYKDANGKNLKIFNNNDGNRGIIHINQVSKSDQIEKMLRELLDCERKRIRLLESLLICHDIKF